MKYFLLRICICLFIHIPQSIAQTSRNKVLTIGDTLPDIQFEMANYKMPTAKLSSFKSKLIILDYWAGWCPSCIHAMPNLDNLQKKFGNDIRILPVAFTNTHEEVKSFFDKRKGTKLEIDLPSAVYKDFDNELFRMLPANSFPHEVWLDSNRVIIAITESVYVTENNIRKLLNGEKIPLPVKTAQMDFDASKPLLVNGNGGEDTAFTYRSMITPYNAKIISSSNWFIRTERYTRIFFVNASVVEMVKAGLYDNDRGDLYNKMIALETDNNDRLVAPEYDTNYIRNMQQRAYCYELLLPSTYSKEEARKFMLEDVCRYFGIEAKFEKRMMPCWVLKRTSGNDKLHSKGGNYTTWKVSDDETRVTIKNSPMSNVISFMMNRKVPFIIDETNYKENVDIELNLADKYNIKSLNKMLAKYDLALQETSRYIDALVIRDKRKYSN